MSLGCDGVTVRLNVSVLSGTLLGRISGPQSSAPSLDPAVHVAPQTGPK